MDDRPVRLGPVPQASDLPALGTHGEGWVAIQTGIAIAVLLAGGLSGPAWSGPLRLVTDVVGVALLAVGVGLFGWGARTLGPSFSIWLRPREDARLVESGPYRHLRHPICTSQAIFGLGWALMGASPLALLLDLVYVVYLDLGKLAREEEFLLAAHPGYAAYRLRVPYKLIPRIH
ncbi:MAG: methyltransferase family protein [Candidatus Limnocylindrales bacterium]